MISLQTTYPPDALEFKNIPSIGDFESKKDGKDQDTIQSSSIPYPGYHTEK